MTESVMTGLRIPARREVLRIHKERGGLVAAVFPYHYPRALLRTFGILPVEVWGPPGVDTTRGDSHLQAYTCNIVRNGLSFLLSGGLEDVDLILVPHGCDSLQGLGSLLLDFTRPRQPVLTLYLPRGDAEDTGRAIGFFADEFRSLCKSLSAITGREPSDPEFLPFVAQEESADELRSELYRQRRRLPLTDREFYTVMRSREFLPAEEFIRVGHDALRQKLETPRAGVPLVLSGIVPEPMEVLDALSAAGGILVADDLLSSGRRLYPPGRDDDPFRRMAENILLAPPDSTRGSSIESRIGHLHRLCEDSAARGVIFHNVKFCEPELFYMPLIRKSLAAKGIRSVETETDLGRSLPHQMVTRIEAFLETFQ